jgi:hypothetical protein
VTGCGHWPDEPTRAYASRLVKGAILKVYKGASHGLCTTHKNQVNAELLAFLKV